MACIDIRSVRKTYPGQPAETIKGIECHVQDGEFLVMLGPSGCGKSTLLRMVAGLETITVGEVAIGKRVVNDLEPKDRDIAMVFQNYALYPHMSVFDNMAYGLKIRNLPKAEILRRVQEAAEILELTEYLARRPRQLSGGQRQRVAMGRALVREPSAFLFDEPLSNLDAKLRTQMRVEIKRLQQRLGTTSLYVTHDQVEAMTLADRLMVMNGGLAEQIGTPMEVYHRPASVFVAGFIGSPGMNILPGHLGEDGESIILSDGQARLPLPADHLPLNNGQEITVGLRPEHLVLEDSGPLCLAVDLVEALGADVIVHGRFGGDRSPILARLPSGLSIRTGDTLPLAVTPAHIHLFDPKNGRSARQAPGLVTLGQIAFDWD